MAFNLGSIVGGVLSRLAGDLIKGIQDWFAKRKAAEDEARVVTLEAHIESEKEVNEASASIEKAATDEAKSAAEESSSLKREVMLEHLRDTNTPKGPDK